MPQAIFQALSPTATIRIPCSTQSESDSHKKILTCAFSFAQHLNPASPTRASSPSTPPAWSWVGYAVCFTADSGVGKSTRARAWVDGLGAEFISGDRPAIRLEPGGNLACGVPWDGKEQIFRNVERPLKAILEVRRAPFTRLRRLSPEQAFGVLIRQSFIPMWDTDTAALAMANVRRLSRTTPVYRLFCGPEVDDARAVHRILFEHPEEIEEELPEMKVREGFVLRTVVDEHMVMPTGANIGKFGGAVVLNDVSAFIWKQMEKPISRDDLLAQILGEFDVDEATASRDLDALLDQLREMELLEE